MAAEQSEEMKKCGSCNKSVNPAKRFYRNGRYYCNQNCWRKKVAELKASAAEGQSS